MTVEQERQLAMFEDDPSVDSPLIQPHRFVRIDVRGVPRPQGSMQPIQSKATGRVFMQYPKTVHAWRAQVQQTVTDAAVDPFEGPVELRLGFDMPRPIGHYGTGKNVNTIRKGAPLFPTTMPDLDKLVRAIGDACTAAGLWHDDSQVVSLRAAKRYVLGRRPAGVLIVVSTMQAT